MRDEKTDREYFKRVGFLSPSIKPPRGSARFSQIQDRVFKELCSENYVNDSVEDLIRLAVFETMEADHNV